jgi:hypothetical protein
MLKNLGLLPVLIHVHNKTKKNWKQTNSIVGWCEIQDFLKYGNASSLEMKIKVHWPFPQIFQ